MKLMNRLTLRYLQQNKKRTILTILCIAVSVVMISCVGIAFYSGQQFYKDYLEKTIGDYHYTIVDNNQDIINFIKNDEEINEYYFSRTDYLNVEDNTLNVIMKRGDFLYFDKMNYQDYIIQGRLPIHSHEIVLSKEFFKITHQSQKTIGDTIVFMNPENQKQITFKIVGIMNTIQSKNMFSNNYNALSYIDLSQGEYYTMYVRDKDVSTHIFDHVENIKNQITELKGSEVEDISYNSSYLAIQNIFEEDSQSSFLVFYRLIAIILLIIVFISVSIIYQAFNLSTNDRIQYLGMLSSVGATPKQKKYSVYYEGILLSIVAIPLGILISFIGLSVAFVFVNQLDYLKAYDLSIHTQISVSYFIIVILLSIITIFISLYLPARKISRISVLDALRKHDEIKIKSKKLKRGFISKRFSIIYQLALKNYKRQGRRSRIIVFSLVVSMVSFVSIYSFGKNMMKQLDYENTLYNYDVELNLSSDEKQMSTLLQYLNTNENIKDYIYISDVCVYAKIDKSYLDFDMNELYLYEDEQGMVNIHLIGINQEKYDKICKDNDIQYHRNQALLFNSAMLMQDDTYHSQKYKQMDKNFISYIEYREDIEQEYKKILPVFDLIEIISNDQYDIDSKSNIHVIVPISSVTNMSPYVADNINFQITCINHKDVTEDLKNLQFSPFDYAQQVESTRDLFTIAQIFVYGFVCIMIIFSLLNIINMMNASIDKRKKEFGMLLSVGMSSKDIHRMIFYECFIYGLKTFLYYTPLCLFIEYILFKQLNIDNFIFMPSIGSYFISFIVIVCVMLITFRISLNKFKKQNIIETLKDDM